MHTRKTAPFCGCTHIVVFRAPDNECPVFLCFVSQSRFEKLVVQQPVHDRHLCRAYALSTPRHPRLAGLRHALPPAPDPTQHTQLLYTVHGLKHPVAARQPGGGGGSGGSKALGGGLSEVSKVLAARRRQKQPPPPPLTRAGALRLLEAAKLVLERLGDAEETMNLAESAWALMFG